MNNIAPEMIGKMSAVYAVDIKMSNRIKQCVYKKANLPKGKDAKL